MGPFWGGFFEEFKGCGKQRGAAAFCAACGGLLVMLILALALKDCDATQSAPVLVILGLWAVIWFAVALRRAWLYGKQRAELSRLSSDELAKARSKLKNRYVGARTFPSVKPPVRVPDTDLRY